MKRSHSKRAGLPGDAIRGAEVVRHYKPQPEAYLKTVDFLGLAPGDCMRVAAHENDLEAAAACGLRTAYVHRPAEYDDTADKPLPAQDAFDIVASDFPDIAERLGSCGRAPHALAAPRRTMIIATPAITVTPPSAIGGARASASNI